jgi:rare lipoprotein A
LSIARCGRKPHLSLIDSRLPWLFNALAGAGLALSLAGCSDSMTPGGSSQLRDESLGFSPRVVALGEPVPKGGGVFKLGAPYNVAGDIYVPKEDPTYDKVGMASWYGVMFHGRKTSNGEVYDMNSLTAAHPTLPIPSYVRVTNLNNQRSIIVRINDRGPYKKDRILDMSEKAAELLDIKTKGTGLVRVQYVGNAPLDGDDRYERKVLARQPWVTQVEASKPLIAGLEPPARMAKGKMPVAPAGPVAQGAPPASRGLVMNASASAPLYPHAQPQPAPRPRGVFIQAGVFRDAANAEQVRRKIAGYGRVEVTQVTMGNDVLHRVSIGPFAAEREARAVLDRGGQAGLQGAVIVSR